MKDKIIEILAEEISRFIPIDKNTPFIKNSATRIASLYSGGEEISEAKKLHQDYWAIERGIHGKPESHRVSEERIEEWLKGEYNEQLIQANSKILAQIIKAAIKELNK